MSKYRLCGKFSTAPENRDTLVDILSKAADLMKTAEGCQAYIVYRDVDDDGGVWVTEIWDSEEAHDQSLKIHGVADLIAKARPIITGVPVSGKLTPVHGVGL